jgi:hypothetical protein
VAVGEENEGLRGLVGMNPVHRWIKRWSSYYVYTSGKMISGTGSLRRPQTQIFLVPTLYNLAGDERPG